MCVLGVFFFQIWSMHFERFPSWLSGKEAACQAGDLGWTPGLGRAPGNGNLIQYSCLGNPMDRGAWWDTVHGVAQSQI